MFTLDTVTLRPLEPADGDAMYAWAHDPALATLAGWGRLRAKATFQQTFAERLATPREDQETLGVVVGQQLVGYVQLALIDVAERRAAIGIVLGDRSVWGTGVGKTAIRLMLDYAFTIRNLERVYAECYGFNRRAHQFFTQLGFHHEGVLRQHEVHNGARQDLYVFGILNHEFQQRYGTRCPAPTA